VLQRRQIDVRHRAADHRAVRRYPPPPGARFAKRVCSRRNASFTTPVGTVALLGENQFAVPASGLFGSLL
jgi:hypothetical protein